MERALLKIRGIVQGVGFRPFIHKLVEDCGLRGYIVNTSSGVALELEGERAELERFAALIPLRAPKLALIEEISVEYSRELVGYPDFTIRESRTEEKRRTLISPDVCICDDCLRELLDPADRRYRYPFINCTNCGPRFTIVRDIPYDRANTSMAAFPMCPDCRREYEDIRDRRYHAQPDCCADCGPELLWLNAGGKPIPGDALSLAQEALQAGKIIAVKGLGGIHLACRCDDAALVQTLRQRKQRDEKPFALMCRDVETARRFCRISPEEEESLRSFRRPIVLLKKKQPHILSHVSENGYVGVMLPYTPLHVLLMDGGPDALIMTSANLSDSPILYENAAALQQLSGIADGFLLHQRDIQSRCDDSLLWVVRGREYLARRSRGYVPYPVSLPFPVGELLACGAEQKASFCLSQGRHAFPSAHIGDLKNMETLAHYQQQIEHFQRLFDIRPTALVCDLHPDYLSTQYAVQRSREEGIPLIQIQHHHAHMASCLADNGHTGPAIGLVWDGTGYGSDGTIWGAECLIGDFSGFTRFGSMRPIPLIGGDRAAKELDRIAYALLRECGLPCSNRENASRYEKMLSAGLNCPLSSGMGRLFDGVAALLDIRHRCSYEGQGAVLLEAAAAEGENGFYPFAITNDTPRRFDWRETIRAMLEEKAAAVPTALLAARFMNTLCAMALSLCRMARDAQGLHTVALSGGSFQNMYLLQRLPAMLEAEGFTVLLHHHVCTNDEGLSLGQIMLAQVSLQ